MKAPSGLNAPGRAAWRAAIESLGESAGLRRDAAERYARAVDDEAHLRSEWDALGRPVLTAGGATGSASVPHPLPKMIRDAAVLANALADEVGLGAGKRGAGRPAGAVSAKDRKGEPPKFTRLRAV